MKQLRTGLLAVALFLGLAGVFAMKAHETNSSKLFSNFDYSLTANPSITDLNVTRAQAKIDLGCPGDATTLCGQAYDVGHVNDPAHRRTVDDIFKH